MSNSPVLKEAKRLYNLGFAILWLHPKSKQPIGNGWASGPRKSWEELERTYKDDNNVGVLLGEASQIGERTLAVIDVDIKSSQIKHLEEAEAALEKLIGQQKFPQVKSGRGGGSRHLYCVVDAPFKTWNPAGSDETVVAIVPSKKPSKQDKAELSERALSQGARIVRAWEISYYSKGRQVVLPPSIHPDTKQKYVWVRPLDDVTSLPVMDLTNPNEDVESESREKDAARALGPVVEDLKINEAIDIRWYPGIDEGIRALIVDGHWRGEKVTDRSAMLLVAARGLFDAGLGKDGVLTVLTDRTTFLGECAYDHAKTDSRRRAALWLWKYTVKKVMQERNAAAAFEKHAVVMSELPNDNEGDKRDASKDPRDNGFYEVSTKGKRTPAYSVLLSQFIEDYEYKSVADMKAVFVFNGTHYEDMLAPEIKGYAEMCFDPKPSDTIRTEFYNKVIVNNLIRRRFFLETTEGKFNFQNGVYDIAESTMLDHAPEFGFRGVLPFEFDASARCPKFKAWLADIMEGDKQLIAVLQEFMGYIIRGGEYKYHKALWLSGKGRNGKSTFIDVLKALIGPQNYTTISIKSLVGDRFAAAELDGKIANFSEETSPQELADSGPFKNLTGDGEVNAQKKFGDPFTFRNRAKLIMTYNEIPDLKDLSPGMLSRPIVIPFLKHIQESEMDRDIKKKLLAELPGIFNFALEGWRRLEEQGEFTESTKSKQALGRMQEESCNAYQWVEHCVKFIDDTEKRTPVKDMYGQYRMFEKYPYSLINFSRRIANHPMLKKRKYRTESERGYWGVVLP